MKKLTLSLIFFSATIGWLLAYPGHVQADSETTVFSGVWHGTLDGLPGVTVTLADDDAGLQGTVVMYAVNGKEHRVLFADICTVLHAQVNGKMLLLEMKHHGKSDKIFHLQIVVGSKDTARLKCIDCGPGAPEVEISKENYLSQ